MSRRGGQGRLGHVGEVLSHLLGQDAHANAGEVVDGEPDVARVLSREEALEAGPQRLIGHACSELNQADFFRNVLEQNLDKDTATRRGLLLVEVDDGEAVPAQGVGSKHVTEQHSNVPQLVVLVPMDRLVVLDKGLLEEVAPQPVDLGKALTNQAKELGVCLLLRATLDNHRRQLGLLADGEVNLHQFVNRFLWVGARHDGEIDGPPQVDQVGVGLVLDFHGFRLFVFFVLGTLILVLVLVALFVIAGLAQNLRLEPLVGLFMLLPLRVILEDVEPVLHVNLAVKLHLVCDLVLLLHQVQLLLDGRVVLELVLPNLEEHLNHVLRSLVDVGLVKDVAELVEDGHGDGGLHLLEVLPDLLAEADGDLDAVVRRLVQQQQQDLAGQHLVLDLLVDEVGEEGGRREADGLVVALEALAELHDEALDQQLADLRQLGVDNGRHGRVDGRKGQARGLGLHDGAAEEAAAAHQVLAKQLGHNVLDVGRVDLVDQAVDALLERLPRHPLVLLAALVRDLRLQRPQPRRRDVRAARPHVEQLLVLGLCRRLLLLLRPHGRGRGRGRRRARARA